MEKQSREFPGRSMNSAMLQERARRRRRKIFRMILAWLLVIFIVVAVISIAVILIMAGGGNSLRKNTQSNKPNLVMEELTGEQGNLSEETTENSPEGKESTPVPTPAIVWQEGWVRHDGKIYAYNEDIMTFLVLGIDKEGVVKESSSPTEGGQADAIFLVIVNPDVKDIKILAVNRDTMTDIQMYGMGPDGSPVTTYAQLAVQHGFGGGTELSCELTVDAVSNLFYDLPIHGYVAVNMGAIAQLNDAVGGIEVTVLEDLTKVNKKWTEGTEVALKGKDAFYYVKWRDITIFESNRGRLARQKQYLSAFAAKVMEAARQDITLPITLYQQLSKYMVTDISMNEITYLVGELLTYSFDSEEIYTLEGTTEMGEKHEEFYPDKAALKKLMLQLFYEEVAQ